MSELKSVPNGVYEDDYLRVPITRTRWQAFKRFLYNAEEKTYLNKTKKQWGITSIFYLLFFSGLALLFAVCLKAMMATLNDERPRYILADSLIGTNPGLSYRPLPPNKETVISFSGRNVSQVNFWVDELDKFLEEYRNSSTLPNGGRYQRVCSYEDKVREGMVCEADISTFDSCSSENKYGFNQSSPCIFIKLNRLFGWVPEPYNDPNDLPSKMPTSLKDKIKSLKNKPQLNTIWLSCNGTNAEHVESMGEIKYYSMDPLTQGFPSYFYPYQNIPGYLSPLVAVQFSRPKRDKKISIQCEAWAKNINHDRINQIGVVNFILLVNK